MKKIFLFPIGILFIAASLSLQGCLDDDDDDDRFTVCPTGYPNALVTVKPNADNTAFRMQLDDSTQLWPVNMRQSPFGTKEVRALVNFRTATKEEMEKGGIYADIPNVFVNWIDSILTKPFIENTLSAEENLAQYGSDPLEIVDDWMTVVEDGYLTLRFRTRWGGKAVHTVNLVHRTDVNTPLYFTLYHDAKGDTSGEVGDALVAFKLPEWIGPGTGTLETLTLEWQSYSGIKTVQFKLHPQKEFSYGSGSDEQHLGNLQKAIE